MCLLVRYVFGLKDLKNEVWVGMCLLVRYVFFIYMGYKSGMWLLVGYVFDLKGFKMKFGLVCVF